MPLLTILTIPNGLSRLMKLSIFSGFPVSSSIMLSSAMCAEQVCDLDDTASVLNGAAGAYDDMLAAYCVGKDLDFLYIVELHELVLDLFKDSQIARYHDCEPGDLGYFGLGCVKALYIEAPSAEKA